MPYNFEQLVALLNELQPYDWAKFFRDRLTSKSPHAPLGGIENGGYRIEYTDQPNTYTRGEESKDRGVNAWYSLGFRLGDNTIEDVLIGSPAYNAGVGPDMKLISVNGRRATDELLRQAIRTANKNQPIELILENTGFFKVVKIDYHGGERYPHLVRQEGTPARLDDILKPMTKHPQTRSAE